uniref:hypothetical protein n=1 Tax=Pleurosigma intermedium TaxID=197753 RepID=UPI002182037B|nr:hypothetical protein N4L43_pgp003 [Pleurosigma intermedium]UVG41940.1 hypothetical protein [Pleurosigma intermedium]
MKLNKRKLKLSNFFNKKNHKNRKKHSGKKRRIFLSTVLAESILSDVLFGNLVTNDLKTQRYSNATPLIKEKVISAQEFNSLNDSRNSGQTVRTGNGTILEFQLNEPDDIILVKGDGILPGAEAFPLSLPQRTRCQTTTGMNEQNPGQGKDGGNSNTGYGSKSDSCSSNPTPRFPHQLSPNNQNQNKNKKNKNRIEVKIVDGQIILLVTRDDMTFSIDEMTARKKIYHAPDFDVALPDNLDLESVKSLSTKDRLKYLSDPDILPQECVGEYMKKLGQHLLDPTTEIKVGTLGGNGAIKGWNETIPGTHAFNSGTGNDIFFADDGFKFHTGMNLNDGQRIDLEDNKNIL